MFRKVIASVLTFTFLVQSLGFSQIQPLELSVAQPVQIEIPKEFGEIVSAPFAPSKSNFIIHIQDAHGSYEAQQNIEKIICHLAERYKIKTLFLEGGAGKLVPEQFHFFEDRKLDLKVADLMMKRGAFTGAEKFLLSGKAEGYGIEDISFYRDNFILFESAVNAQPQADLELKKSKAETQNQLNRIFSKDARDFVKSWELHQSGKSDWMRYLSVLDNAAQKHLAVDLRNPENQIDFPMLVRYFNLKNRNIDAEKAAGERKAFLEFLKGKISADLYQKLLNFEESENPRGVFESLQEEISKKQIKLPEYPNFIRYAGNRMLQSEMKSKELFTEMNQLANRILAKLVTTPKENKILTQIREHILLEKLAHLELTREEWNMLRNNNSVAADFYRAAEKRESAFLKNIESLTKKNKIHRAILVTGGFHAEGFESKLKQLGYSFITIRPNFTDTENSQKNYLGAMLPETSQLVRALELNAPKIFEALITPRWSAVYRHERDAAVQEVAGKSLGTRIEKIRRIDEMFDPIQNILVGTKEGGHSEAVRSNFDFEDKEQKAQAVIFDTIFLHAVLSPLLAFYSRIDIYLRRKKVITQEELAELKNIFEESKRILQAFSSTESAPVITLNRGRKHTFASAAELLSEGEGIKFESVRSGFMEKSEKAIGEIQKTLAPFLEKIDQILNEPDLDGQSSGTSLGQSSVEDIEKKMPELFKQAGLDRHADFMTTDVSIHLATQPDITDLMDAMNLKHNLNAAILDLGHGQGELAIKMAAHINLLFPGNNIKIRGIEFDGGLYQESLKLLKAAEDSGFIREEQVQFFQGDFNAPSFHPLFNDTDVIHYASLGTRDTKRLGRTLFENLTKRGARIVEHGSRKDLESAFLSLGIPHSKMTNWENMRVYQLKFDGASLGEKLDSNFLERQISSTEKAAIQESVGVLNPGYDRKKLFGMLKWDPARFERENLPAVIGEIQDREIFGEQKGMRILDLPIRMPGQGWAIPKELEQFKEVIRKAVEFERTINLDFDEKYYVYITVDQKKVEPHKSQRRHGYHGDAFINSENTEIPGDLIADNTYVVSDVLPTEFLPGPFSLEGINPDEDKAVLDRFDDLSKGKTPVVYPPYTLLKLTPFDVHTSALNETDKTIERTFVKISFSREKYNLIGNQINPFFNYADWVWVPRKPGVRNHRNVAAGSSLGRARAAQVTLALILAGPFGCASAPPESHTKQTEEILREEGSILDPVVSAPENFRLITKTIQKTEDESLKLKVTTWKYTGDQYPGAVVLKIDWVISSYDGSILDAGTKNEIIESGKPYRAIRFSTGRDSVTKSFIIYDAARQFRKLMTERYASGRARETVVTDPDILAKSLKDAPWKEAFPEYRLENLRILGKGLFRGFTILEYTTSHRLNPAEKMQYWEILRTDSKVEQGFHQYGPQSPADAINKLDADEKYDFEISADGTRAFKKIMKNMSGEWRLFSVEEIRGSSLGSRMPLLLAGLMGLAACATPSERPVVSPRRRTEPETAPVVSARPAVERPAPREFRLADRPGRRDQIHGWMKSNQIEVDIFRQPRMAISFRTNRPRTIWVQFKNSLRQDLVQGPAGGDLRVELPDTQGQFQTIELNLRDHLVPGIIDTEAVIEIILGDENARPVEINPIMYEAADGKSLGNSKSALDKLAKSYREKLHQSLRAVILWEGWSLWQMYVRLFYWDEVQRMRQKFSGQNLMAPRRWIHSAVIQLNRMEKSLKDESPLVFKEVSRLHHQLLGAMERNSDSDEYGFSAAYGKITSQIYWDIILQKHDSRIELQGEEAALIPVSDIRNYIYLVRRVIPGLGAGEDKTDSISAASLGRTAPTARQLEIRFDEICDLLVNAKKYKRANSSLKEIILEHIESVDAALRNAQLFEAAQKLRKLVAKPEFQEVMPETFILNAQKFVKELERLTIPKDIIDWLRRGSKKKERYSAERVRTFDEILQKNYKNLLGEQLLDQMWRSIASALFGGRHDEIPPLDEESYEFDIHDVFASETGWIPRANRYITQTLMTAILNGNFRQVISAALYLEDQTEEIKKAAFTGGYGPMVWASVLHHYAMLAIYEKNFQRPSNPPTAASSLGSEKIKIPGSVWVPVEMIENYANQTQFERDLADGFFRREADGSLWAPVIRDPSILHPETIHGRSIHFETRVIKGSGLQEAVKGVPYSYDPHNIFESAKFRGGETKFYSHHAALSAQKIRAAYEEALLIKDPAVLLAKEKYGTKEEPVLKPLYLVRPLKIPVFRFGSTELLDAEEVLREMKVPEHKIKQRAIFIYETPLNDRLNEISRFNKDFANIPAVYGNPKDSAEILRTFAARLALANYLMHERLNGTFTAEYEDAEDFPPFVSSLDLHNITAAGYITDLDTVETEWKEKSPEKLQARDEKLARDAIKYFAGKINVPKEIGYQVYDEVRGAGKSAKTEASSLGAASDLVGGEINLRYLQRIREIVTAGRDPQKKTVALYPGSGADISTALLSTDADEFIFVDKMIFDLPGYTVSEEEKKKRLEEYLNQKAQTNYALAVTIEAMRAIKPFLEKELEILGAQDVRISARKGTENVFDVKFVWNERPRKITFVSGADMRFLSEYQEHLPKNGKVDFVIIKAGQYRTFLNREVPRNTLGQLTPPGPQQTSGGLAGVVIEENGFIISDNPAAMQFSFVQSGVVPVEDSRLEDLRSSFEADFGYDKAYLFRKTASASSLGKYVLDHPEEKLAQDALGSLINMRFIIPDGMIARIQRNFEQLNEMVKTRFPEDSQSLQAIYLDASRHIENMKGVETMRFDHLASIWESLDDYLIEYQYISEELYEGDALDVLEFAVQADMERIEKIFPQFLELRLPDSEDGIAVMALVDPEGNLYPATPEKWAFGNLISRGKTRKLNRPEEIFTYLNQGWSVIFFPTAIDVEELSPSMLMSVHFEASSLGKAISDAVKLEVARVYTNRIVWMPGVSNESLKSALKTLGLFKKKTVNVWGARSAKFNRDFGAVSKYLGISAESLKGVPIILEDSVYRNQPAAQEVAEKLLGAMQDRDLLAVDWENQKPAFISKLRQAANRRFEVKDVQRKTFTNAVLKQWTRRFDAAPIWIGTVGEENAVQISFSSGDKIKLNLDILHQNGIDPTQVVALLRQIAAQPDKRQELFSRAGFTKSADGWEVGQNFVSLLLNKIYADQAANRTVQAAA